MNHGAVAFPGTLLDWFAGQAMTAITISALSKNTKTGYTIDKPDFLECLSLDAYAHAEAMIKVKGRYYVDKMVEDHSTDAGKMVELEKRNRELVERINQLESVVNDPHALWANWLRGTVKLPEAIGDVRQYKERIKQLEKAGNEVVYWFSPMAKHQLTPLHLAALNQWNAAKEIKP